MFLSFHKLLVNEILKSPQISRFNENDVYRRVTDIDIQAERNDDGLYTVLAERKVQISQMLCPTTIRCTLSIPGTNYTRRVETIFYGKYWVTQFQYGFSIEENLYRF